MNDIAAKLSAPFQAHQIHWRLGSTNQSRVRKETGNQNALPTKGIPLAYLDARDVMERLDEVVGPFNWQVRYPFTGCCELSIKDPETGEWVTKANGAGVTDIEAEKGQYSDAFKRAGVMFGIGRYLYDLPNTWVDLVNGKLSGDTILSLSSRLETWTFKKFNTGEKK